MKRQIPVLTITLQVPLVPSIDAQEVLEALAQTLNEALEQVREQAEEPDTDELAETGQTEETAPTMSAETLEPYTDATRANLLESLGYSAQP